MYSQADEERVILDYFAGKQGKLLDIGAHDGRTFSNSLALIESGWSAVLVEPNPYSMVKLLALHGTNKSVQLINCAIRPDPYLLMEFWACDDATSTAVTGFRDTWIKKHATQFAPLWIAPILPATLIQLTGQVDFISIDVEDGNLALAVSMSDYLSRTPLVCIEHSGCGLTSEAGLEQLFVRDLGFRILHKTPENYLFAQPSPFHPIHETITT